MATEEEVGAVYSDEPPKVIFLVRLAAWILLTLAKLISKVRAAFYDPYVSPKSKCPACGYKGCRLNFIATADAAKGAIECSCLQCGAKFYQKPIIAPDKWMARQQLVPDTIQQKLQNTVL